MNQTDKVTCFEDNCSSSYLIININSLEFYFAQLFFFLTEMKYKFACVIDYDHNLCGKQYETFSIVYKIAITSITYNFYTVGYFQDVMVAGNTTFVDSNYYSKSSLEKKWSCKKN